MAQAQPNTARGARSPIASPPERARCTGVAEWAPKSVNCVTGCSHNCRYCYAAFDACDRYHRVKRDEWEFPRVRDHDVRKRHGKYDGTVMFPSTHDITPEVLEPCLLVLGNLLSAGNHVLKVGTCLVGMAKTATPRRA